MKRTIFSLVHTVMVFLRGGGHLFKPRNIPADNGLLKSCVVLAAGCLPTSDFYLRGRLESEYPSVQYLNVLTVDPRDFSIDSTCFLVVVRHLPLSWLLFLAKHKGQIGGLAYFLDDDLPAATTATELPFLYALKLSWRYTLLSRFLADICTEIWVSTAELAQRYAAANPRLLEPYPPDTDPRSKSLTYFYHGSWAHKDEMEWLVPIVKEVQRRFPDVWFEIIGTIKVKHLFRDIPRVRVVHPMSWPDYLAYSSNVQYDLGLAPCLDSHFNRARSHCKFFDITRIGAAGIYSSSQPYKDRILHRNTGVLCDNVPALWVEAIVELLDSPQLRQTLLVNARQVCLAASPTSPTDLNHA